MKELTKAEEQVMQILWDVEKGFVKDLLEKLNINALYKNMESKRKDFWIIKPTVILISIFHWSAGRNIPGST